MCNNQYLYYDPCAFDFVDQDLGATSTDSLLLASSFYPLCTVPSVSWSYTNDYSNIFSSVQLPSPSISSCSSPEAPVTPLSLDLIEDKVPAKKPRKSTTLPKAFICHLCSRSFARKHDLQRHIRVHTGAKPYACLNCKKAFARTDALKRHLRMEDTCRTSPIIQAMKSTGSRRYRNL